MLFVLVALLGAVAWLTRHPDAEIVREAEEWPLVGPVARRFRQAYLPPEIDPKQVDTQGAPELHRPVEVVVVAPDPEVVGARPYVWVQPDTPIYSEPDCDSQILFTTAALGNLSILRSESDWYRVIQPMADGPAILGWVILEGYREPQPARLSTPEPVVPLAASSIDSKRLSLATSLMTGGGQEIDCGPYRLHTDAVNSSWIDLCPGLVEDLERVFRTRYGLEPVSPPAETILLFETGEDYLTFRDQEEVPFEAYVAHSFPSRGYVALYEADRSTPQILSSLVHELTHLLSRRSVGPALPAWLAEGMADDLAESSIDETAKLSPGVLCGEARQLEGLTVNSGGSGSLLRLKTLDQLEKLPELRELLQLEGEDFYGPERVQLHYALSSFWIRYLLRDPADELAEGFRGYLDDIAAGTPITNSLLIGHLGSDLETLEAGFRQWLRSQSVG
jgi:hypothetical protein